MKRIGIIGTGGIANSHARAIANLADVAALHAVMDIDGEKAKEFAEKHGAKKVYADRRELLSDGDVDMVIVCTPAFNHAELVVDSVEAGKPVLCEKPIAGSLRQMDAMIRAVEKHGGAASSIFQLRYGEGLKLFRKLQEEGITGRFFLGQVNVFWRRTMEYYNMAEWRGTWKGEMGGALLTLGIHAIDSALSVSPEPVSVYSAVETLNHDIETDDTSSSVIRLKDGAMFNVNVTTNNQEQFTQISFMCENVIAVSNTNAYRPTRWPWTFSSADENMQKQLDEYVENVKPDEEDGSHQAQIRDFILHLEHGETPPVSVHEVRRTIEILTAIYKSGLTGRIVELPIKEGDPFYEAFNGKP